MISKKCSKIKTLSGDDPPSSSLISIFGKSSDREREREWALNVGLCRCLWRVLILKCKYGNSRIRERHPSSSVWRLTRWHTNGHIATFGEYSGLKHTPSKRLSAGLMLVVTDKDVEEWPFLRRKSQLPVANHCLICWSQSLNLGNIQERCQLSTLTPCRYKIGFSSIARVPWPLPFYKYSYLASDPWWS